ncbi:MAG TPA: hypothetical protein VF942_04310 [Acidimicrobiales bacterium]
MDGDRFLADLAAWAESQQAASAARSRSRRRWLRQQAAEGATLAGTLLDLAESSVPVSVYTAGGDCVHSGLLIAVGTRVCVLSCDQAFSVIALSAITTVVPAGAGLGDRAPSLELDLAGVLAVIVVDRPSVQLQLVDGRTVCGVLEQVGQDVVTVSQPDALIPTAAIAACRF